MAPGGTPRPNAAQALCPALTFEPVSTAGHVSGARGLTYLQSFPIETLLTGGARVCWAEALNSGNLSYGAQGWLEPPILRFSPPLLRTNRAPGVA